MRKTLLATATILGFAGPAGAQTLATIGGVPITMEQVTAADPAAKTDAATRNKVLIALVNRQAVINEAKKSGITQSPDYKAALAQAEDNIAINLTVKNFAASHPVSDQQISDAYNKLFSQPAPEEYRFREILVSSFKDGQSIIADLKSGQEFSILAAKTSQDKSATIGGEVGWQIATQLQAPLLQTLQTMKVGQVAGPVSVPQGFVVLQLLDTRTSPKPTLDQIKPQLTTAIQQQEWIDQVVKWRTAQGAKLIVPLAGG